MDRQLKSICILGGGTAGWMTAAALSHHYKNSNISILLIESEQIGTIGVGEATIPHIRHFNAMLGIPENEFIKQTQATYKLGIEFQNWGSLHHCYMHPFGVYGQDIGPVEFHKAWAFSRLNGGTSSLFDFSSSIAMAKERRFAFPNIKSNTLDSRYSYAFHFDASLYAQLLRKFSEDNGVKRIEGKVNHIHKNEKSGEISSLTLANEASVSADFFIDCSGFKSLLIGESLGEKFDSWSQWLLTDSAIAMPSKNEKTNPRPYTISRANDAGWYWSIPLKSRVGNGNVYSASFTSDEKAHDSLIQYIEGDILGDGRVIRFTPGRRKKSWVKNCVAIGLSSGFLEPLESTSLYLIQVAIMKLLELMPVDQHYEHLKHEFNHAISFEYEKIRDFIILHYKLTQREDTEFWQYCKNMTIPGSLQNRIDLFKENAYINDDRRGLFLTASWLSVMVGQGLMPKYSGIEAESLQTDKLNGYLEEMKAYIAKEASTKPYHIDTLNQTVKNTNLRDTPPSSMSFYSTSS
ncbi:tryptophan 7-halogenase [Gilvimarinus agarilyticus]|uniref:tryptophan halogenase family protein n=1 Tax=Gilvimarinus sp. 2_MG-2023 TaxID=3062666 RepID=UPI001C08A528|nr:tryptophan halogenase family protein [Gilvimarinus sp. 2_MG-2023]MBU2887497.1 tryptophan 7-halogenase [Gilvimarinus agarilyticus]MDO6572148.1 tryptophan 7-halogenase [Gilvimarinus sp. 2_MG-2023]